MLLIVLLVWLVLFKDNIFLINIFYLFYTHKYVIYL